MNKAQLVAFLHSFLQKEEALLPSFMGTKSITKAVVEEMVDDMLVVFTQVLAVGGKISLPEIGSLRTVAVKERNARNPKTGEKVVVPKHRKVKYTASKQIKEAVNL